MRDLTETQARGLLLRHLTGTLRALPAGTALVHRHPGLPTAVFGNERVVPADDVLYEPGERDDAAYLRAAYWVLGVEPFASAEEAAAAAAAGADPLLGAVLAAWRQWGWRTRLVDRHPRTAGGESPDGFGVSVYRSLRGHLSVFGSSPVFRARPADPPFEPLPDRIDRPAGPVPADGPI
ncbi:hypothetical protein ACIQBJ_14855 [Kitasatospora sp. NPDC088391]|uniref:hypothetical protein n=1 Tax=Kitasatospora sp. NPDC088391 TaxID=3364074 RepID=UPI0038051FF7